MAKISVPIAANSTYLLGNVVRQRDRLTWRATFFSYGAFGGGTLTYKVSPDGGTTLITMKDETSIGMSSTSNDIFNVDLCTGSKNTDRAQLYVVLSGATNANLIVQYDDNN